MSPSRWGSICREVTWHGEEDGDRHGIPHVFLLYSGTWPAVVNYRKLLLVKPEVAVSMELAFVLGLLRIFMEPASGSLWFAGCFCVYSRG